MIHFVYPFDADKIAAPWSIGNHVAAGLRRAGHEVRQYDWDDRGAIQPQPGDVLLGHPHPDAGRIWRNSVCGPWADRVAISPWNGSTEYTRNLDYIHHDASLICICGDYWARQLPPYWDARAVDMAVNPAHFPPLERAFNPPGQRRFAFIGCTLPIKGPEYIAQVAQKYTVGHFGYGEIPGTVRHGYVDFSTNEARAQLAEYDFLVMMADHDANPTTVLEAMSWGIIPLCRRGCGYTAPDVVVIDSSNVVDYWQSAPPDALLDRQRLGFSMVREKYTWERFLETLSEVLGDE